MPLFHCPSVPTKDPVRYDIPPIVAFANTHYIGVNGTDQFEFDGIFHVNSLTKIRDITDGTSNTLMVGERPPAYDGNSGWWLAGSGWYPWFGAADVVVGTAERIAVNGESTDTGPTSKYQHGSFRYEDDGYGWDKHAWHFWSAHGGGSQFLLGDGSARLVAYEIDQEMFRRLGSMNDGEVVEW